MAHTRRLKRRSERIAISNNDSSNLVSLEHEDFQLSHTMTRDEFCEQSGVAFYPSMYAVTHGSQDYSKAGHARANQDNAHPHVPALFVYGLALYNWPGITGYFSDEHVPHVNFGRGTPSGF
jgi:hypothetical protein